MTAMNNYVYDDIVISPNYFESTLFDRIPISYNFKNWNGSKKNKHLNIISQIILF